jgi:Ion channel
MDRAASRERREERWRLRAERARDAFGLVLALVLLDYVLSSLLGNRGWPAVLITLSVCTTSIVALVSSHSAHRAVRIGIGVSAISVLFTLIAALTDTHLWLNFAAGIQIVLLVVAMAAVLRRVITTAEVGSRTILGALSVYAVLGLLFTYLYGLIDRLQSTPFFEGHPSPEGSDFIFFSYTTLTTTGYGNLVPNGQPGEMIAGIEMMLGEIFLVTLVAGLVSLWRPGEGLKRRLERRGQAGVESPSPEPGSTTR